MLWYLLYPLRGTSQPPRLSANHPIRRAFYRHGKTTAQHWLISMLVSVAVAVGFSFPSIFMAENPTAGFAAYPHHVWTSAKPFEGDPVHIDVEMRQVWVHGNYMGALEKDVLRSGLRIQEALVGGENLSSIFPTLNEKLRSSTLTWGYHSPLMYWNSSAQMIDADSDILTTINAQSRTSSSLNVALRPASVFAGKIFDRRYLKAADALVLTFMNKVESLGIGGTWQNRMKSVKGMACENCTLFPFDGDVTRNRVYEFSFTPLSLQENAALAFAYGCMALYVLLSLRRLKAFHSRFGLVVTAITQMTCSVLASFTICGLLKINLSMIPQNAYPFVVLVVGLENMFRLINAILAYPATMATDLRIANALGDVGPVSVATAAQNLIILSLLATFVSPGVAAFCIFACIATFFDAFFLLTFFVAVLNVDIRRLELQDALARSNQHRRKTPRKPSPSQHRHTWVDALLSGRLPFSTRMAGTAVTTTFILSLNYHFFEGHENEKVTSLRHLLGLVRGGTKNTADFDTFSPPPMNATLTPGDWMRMQDFDTAREVMRLAKPGADSFVIRVFAPLIVVLSGADRTGAPLGTEAWTHALAGFARYHFYPVFVAVVFAMAFVAVLMNFLLYSEADDEEGGEDERYEEALTVQSVSLPHRLDIVKIVGNEKGHFVSVALDRTVAVSIFNRAQKSFTSMAIPYVLLGAMQWPLQTAVVDDGGEWLACHCADDQIVIYNCVRGITLGEPPRYPDDNPALLFRFMHLPDGDATSLHLVVLTSGGRLLTKPVKEGARSTECRVAGTALVGASTTFIGGNRKIFAVTEDARIMAFQWSSSSVPIEIASQSLAVDTVQGRLSGMVAIRAQPELDSNLLLAWLRIRIRLADHPWSHRELFSVRLGGPPILRLRFSVSPRMLLTTHLADGEAGPLCLRGNLQSCRRIESASSATQDMPELEEWIALPSHAVIGLRRKPDRTNSSNGTAELSSMSSRHRRRGTAKSDQHDDEDGWQTFKITLDGDIESADVPRASGESSEFAPLYVDKAGPSTPLDSHSAAVAFGNTVKVIRSSRRGTNIDRSSRQPLERQGSSSKRRLTQRKGM
ncbi:hypothetical protein LTR53_014724 [Teratosphaeriaceae sp. CCFEE 6253]|nr:hypothetical protein LTR53_014724 [Teratosphaeriaceae sp. CCFEE 6253]